MAILTTRPNKQRNTQTHQRNGQANGQPPRPVITQPQSAHGKHVSEAEYWAHYYEKADFSYEWNNGILEEKPLPDYVRVSMYGWLQMLLRCYLEVNPIAKMLFLEVGFRLPLGDKTSIRKPDLFVIRHDNPVPLLDDDRSYRGICDLCIESVSDSTVEETKRDTVVKKGEYELVGVKEYFILDPGDAMAFYRRNDAGHYETIAPDAAGIIQSQVLPGFHFRISDLHRQPPLDALVEDPLYRDFVLPKYQVEKKRAERYAAILRQLGIEVE